MNTMTLLQILNEAVCISHRINTLAKGMNPTIHHLAIGNETDRLSSVRQLFLEKENSEFKPVVLRLKTDLVSHPARGRRVGLGTYIP